MNKEEVLRQIQGQLIVSCQGNASDGNPFCRPQDMLQMARAAQAGGCAGFRANGPENIRAIKEAFPQKIMVGIWKVVSGDCEVYITPTMREVEALHALGCEIIAVDGTQRKNCEGDMAPIRIGRIREKYPDQLIMADIATLEEARCSLKAGVDIVSTTLSGYTESTRSRAALGADFELIRQIRQAFPGCLINAEGRIWTREEAKHALDCGANMVTSGTAITNPMAITRRFVDFLVKNRHKAAADGME